MGKQSGLSLVELLISVTLGLLLLSGFTALLVQTKRSSKQNQSLQGLQDQARFALGNISRDLSMAGFWGGMMLPSQIQISPAAAAALPAGQDCGVSAADGWALDAQTGGRLDFFNATSTTDASSQFNCLEDVRKGSDAFGVRRVAGEITARNTGCAPVSLRANNFYLKTNGDAGSIIWLPGITSYEPCTAPDPSAGAMSFFKWLPRIYYLREYAHTAPSGGSGGDRIPTLCRRELQHTAAPKMEEECLAEGVEDLQIVWGVDQVQDGVADLYTSTPAAADLARAVSAQVFLLVRSTGADLNYEDDKTYEYADRTGEDNWVRPADGDGEDGYEENQRSVHFYRQLFSTTIKIRNPAPPPP